MAGELGFLVAASEVPDLHTAVAATHDDALAVRREGHGMHRALVALLLQACAEGTLLDVPDAHSAVQGARCKMDAVTGEAHRAHRLQVAHEDLLGSATSGGPDPHRVVRGSTGEQAAIRGPGHAVHPVSVSPEREQHRSALHIPDADRLVPAPRGDARSVRRESYCRHRKQVALQCGLAMAIGEVPDPNRLVCAGGSKVDCIKGIRNVVHPVFVTPQNLYRLLRVQVPDLHCVVLKAHSGPPRIRREGYSVHLLANGQGEKLGPCRSRSHCDGCRCRPTPDRRAADSSHGCPS
mmetsp:Transcript_75959/g.168247  ORF Transcript_75959/g.168247 Transcript_75959/m.168247 type:complete len:293 (-) Transcript_75959:107-985(-)